MSIECKSLNKYGIIGRILYKAHGNNFRTGNVILTYPSFAGEFKLNSEQDLKKRRVRVRY